MELGASFGQLDFLVRPCGESESKQKKSWDMKAEAEEVQREVDDLVSTKGVAATHRSSWPPLRPLRTQPRRWRWP